MNTITRRLSLFSGVNARSVAAPLLILMILGMMVLPLPAFLLDIMFTFNIALSVMVLLVSIHTLKPLDFAVFPTVLLLTTLLRLSLNVASTRIVLMEGHTGPDAAGKVIEAFGHYLVGGNYAVGIVVFIILVVINFIVITKGAGRIAEVSARFTLDAMPGKQMAIDADLNAGLIGEEEAGKRRTRISQEAEFFGSMDGASKFVRGDAIAGILILFINVIGGLIIGVLQHDLDVATAARNYTLLAIGDGLVAQIPALIISTAAGLVVSRVGTDDDISAVFPTVLLLTTLLRLSLNVASTRIVLMEGHTGPDAAGKVIEAFGHYLVGGNYAVGIVVFIILVVINFIVITKGAGRIAEVSARFTLDAMPGKQMAIDADLNAGLIGEEEAGKRRTRISQEAEFFGSMDAPAAPPGHRAASHGNPRSTRAAHQQSPSPLANGRAAAVAR